MIRCERCSTLYELDEGLLSPSGSPVQCTKCQHVFTAFPSQAPGRTLVGVPAAPPPAESPPAAEAAPAPPPAEKPRPGPQRYVPPAPSEGRPEAPRASFSGSAPVYRPPTPPPSAAAAASVSRSPLLRRDAVGAFEARLRWSARLRWLAPALVAAVLLAAGVAWFLLARRGGPSAAGARREAMALAALDDGASLDQAAARLDAALRRSPGSEAAADRAAVEVLRAAAASEEGEALAARHAARTADRERLRREQAAGWEEAERAAAADAQALEREVRGREERARALGDAAFDALRALQRAGGDVPEIARALALYYALGGERQAAEKAIRAARAGAPGDPWLDLAEGWAEARQTDHAARERALVALGSLAASHPDLLRGRYLLARTQASLGRRGEALASLEALLAANGRHEGAQRLRAELAAHVQGPPAAGAPPPAQASPPAPAPAPAAPARSAPGTAPTQPRKRVAQPPVETPFPPVDAPVSPADGSASTAGPAAGPAPAAIPFGGDAGTHAPAASPPEGGGGGETEKQKPVPRAWPPSEDPSVGSHGG